MKQVTEAELKALSFVLPWVRVTVSREDGGIVNCVPVSPEMRDRLIATIREQRAKIGNGELIPGVVVKDSVVHRRWSDPEVAAQLAQETIGACLRLLVKLLPHIGNYELYDRTKWMISRIERELRNG